MPRVTKGSMGHTYSRDVTVGGGAVEGGPVRFDDLMLDADPVVEEQLDGVGVAVAHLPSGTKGGMVRSGVPRVTKGGMVRRAWEVRRGEWP